MMMMTTTKATTMNTKKEEKKHEDRNIVHLVSNLPRRKLVLAKRLLTRDYFRKAVYPFPISAPLIRHFRLCEKCVLQCERA